MKTSLRLLSALVVTLAIALSSKEARALGPVGIEVGAKVGYATAPSGDATNPLGVGLGGRGGITIFNIYAGLNVIDYLGSDDGLGGKNKALQYGGELGYGIKILFLTLRPQLGLGNITLSNTTLSTSASSFYLEPGVTALLTFGILYFGADINALVITNEPAAGSSAGLNTNTSTATAMTVHGQIGLSF